MKFLSIIGTRPQYIKLSAIQHAFDFKNLNHFYLDSGQHYDSDLSTQIVQDLALPNAVKILSPGAGKPFQQIANLLMQISLALEEIHPDYVLVYGDTNTTLAASLSCSKLNIPFAHIEAGLRSFNRKNQEEKNRLVVDHLADLLFAPTMRAQNNLHNEGLSEKTILVGDVMVDVLYQGFPYGHPGALKDFSLAPKSYYVATLHRAENVDSKNFLKDVVNEFSKVTKKIILFAHPRLEKNMRGFDLGWPQNIIKLPPVSHTEILKWVAHSSGVITDSGGLQKEAFLLKIPCTTLRTETEWTETLDNGWNVLLPRALNLNNVLNRIVEPAQINPYGSGDSALRIVEFLEKTLMNGQ